MLANNAIRITLDILSSIVVALFAMMCLAVIKQGAIYSTRDLLLSLIITGILLPVLIHHRLPALRIVAILILVHFIVLYVLMLYVTATTDKDIKEQADRMAAEVWPHRVTFAFGDRINQKRLVILVVHYGDDLPFAEKVAVFEYAVESKHPVLKRKSCPFTRINGGGKYVYPLLYF